MVNNANDWKLKNPEDEVVAWVPEGAWYSMMPVKFENLDGIIIRIDGDIKASKRHTRWEVDYVWDVKNKTTGEGKWKVEIWNFIDIQYSTNLKFEGKGSVDGQGFMWWLREYVQKNPAGRPNLIEMKSCEHVEFTGIKWMNSPYYHMHHKDINEFYYHDFEIFVDWWGQFILGQFLLARDDEFTIGDFTLPTYPLNTDGIDPAGSNILIERVNITNFDDAVAIKPQKSTGKVSSCSENIIVRDCVVTFGVGMTIGSVPPNDDYNCVRNVTFQRVVFYHPFKAIYVKTNPGTTKSMLPGSGGEITNILYEDMTIHHPIWWSVYIGPQQQKQPGGDGPGCLFYPIGGCETQPLIHVANITLRNVQQFGNILPPGIVRCNSTYPCTGFVFENVNADGWWKWFGLGYITEEVHGEVMFSSPAPAFMKPDGTYATENVPSRDPVEIAIALYSKVMTHYESLVGEIESLLAANNVTTPLTSITNFQDLFKTVYEAIAF
jgi:hypothetical protein